MLGHEVRTATEAETAVRLAREFKPHLALLDLSLAGTDGADLARLLRSLPGLADTVLVAVSGYALGDNRRDRSVFDDHLLKPVEPEHLQDLICRRRQSAPSCG
jgi:two-component system CheB/CheR fusion protein